MMSILGVHRATVVSTQDPAGKKRLRLRIPQLFGDTPTDWVEPAVPGGMIPAPGTPVWVMFVGGNANQPVYLSGADLSGYVTLAGSQTFTGNKTWSRPSNANAIILSPSELATASSTSIGGLSLAFETRYWNGSSSVLEQIFLTGSRASAASGDTFLDISSGVITPWIQAQQSLAGRFLGGRTAVPTTGTFKLRDFFVSTAGKIFVCTTAGTPGVWTEVGAQPVDGVAGTASLRTLGTGSQQAAAGDHTHTQATSHGSPDTDSATSALHHTIGAGANQAAAGNHNHPQTYTSWTPVWKANNATVTLTANSWARYTQIGSLVIAQFSLVANSSHAAGIDWEIAMPVPGRAVTTVSSPVGHGAATVNNAAWYHGELWQTGSVIKLFRSGGTYLSGACAVGDQWIGSLTYEAA